MMSTENMYKKAMRVWIPHQNNVWESAIILEDYDANQNNLFVQGDDSRETKVLKVKSSTELPPLHLSGDSSIDIKSNLSALAVIHEATILQTLRRRFEQRCCYSYCGISMLALNPFSESSEIERNEMSKYQNSNLRNLDPHVFGVAESVYRKLERENCDQTIVFTGESAAGKTVNAERVIAYLTTISSKEDQIREKLLASLVILQAFGHATTTINNNSSRFSKFVQMQYDKNYHIIGALLTVYNLDRSKIVSQESFETIYNIFYYMYAVKENLSHLQLNECQFDYLKRKTDIEAYDVQNKEYFDETTNALNLLGFSEKEQNEIFNILAILLHLRSIKFKKIEGREMSKSIESCIIEDRSRLKTLAKVSGMDEKTLKNMRKWMCYKRKFCDQDEILQPMSLDQAIKARDAIAKFIYTKMFNWLIARINASFRSPCHVQSFIGILDMPGFESLDSNSFEQFCINYIDEKVQQWFIESYFKLEQEEYLREEIDWALVSFSDNLPCLHLIEDKFGILDLLEEETKMSSENNLPWFENLHRKFNKAQNFKKPTENMANFTIHHFIRSVQYNVTDFLAKNYGSVAKEQLEVLREIKNDVLNKFVIDELSKLNITKVKRGTGVCRRSSFSFKLTKKTVTSELRVSLDMLSASLSKTKLSFVRCIKSNDEKKPFTFDSLRVVEQLRAFDVCQMVQMSAIGYFQQRSFKEFFHRYHCLCEFKDKKRDDKREICEKILAAYKKNDVRFGKTKVFLRENTLDHLESQRVEKRQNASIVIQRSVLRFLQQKRYNEIRRLIYGIQRFARGYLVRKRIEATQDRIILEHLSATKIQAYFRGYLEHRWFRYVKYNLPVPQAYKKQVSKHFGRFYSKDVAATEIQKHVKSFLAQRRYKRMLRQIIIVQSFVRRFLAKLKLRNLKYQNKFGFLQQRIDCLMSMHLSPEDLKLLNLIADNQICIQSKNRILNELLFRKIKSLQYLCKDQKPCENQHPQPAVDSNVNQHGNGHSLAFDKPMAEYDKEELYEKLFDSFQNVDRDSKTLQHTVVIEDAELLKLMKSYTNSLRANKSTEISAIHIENKYHNKDVKVRENLVQKEIFPHTPDPNQSSSSQRQTLDTRDLQALTRFSFPKSNDHQELIRQKQILDSAKESEEKRSRRKALRLKIFFAEFGALQPVEVQIPRSSVSDEEKLERQLKAERKFQLIMRGVGDHLVDEQPTGEVAYDGMFEFDLKTTATVIYQLTDVRPEMFLEYDLSPDLPAQILMMCIRYADYKNDYLAALSLLHNFIKRVRFIAETYELLHINVFWLSNTFHLLNYLKQYSKPDDKTYQLDQFYAYNTSRKNQQRLKNIDLRDTWITLEQTCKYFANRIIKEMKSGSISLYSVRALLYSENIYVTKKEEDNDVDNAHEDENAVEVDNVQEVEEVTEVKPTVDILLNELTAYHDHFVKYSVDHQIVLQIFKPIFEYINSVTLSNLLSQSNLCSVSRSIQIRYNLRSLELWAVHRNLASLILLLRPIMQAVRFLRIQPMSQNDIIHIYKNYDKLSGNQMLKIVELYNANCFAVIPASYLKVAVSPRVIDRLKLQFKHHEDLDDTIILDPDEYPIEFPFRHSKVRLEEVEIPQRMNLPMFKKI